MLEHVLILGRYWVSVPDDYLLSMMRHAFWTMVNDSDRLVLE